MELPYEEVISKILTRFPNFETEEDIEKVKEAIAWVCNDGQLDPIVNRTDGMYGNIIINKTICNIKNIRIEDHCHVLYAPAAMNVCSRKLTAASLHIHSCRVRRLREFIEHAKLLGDTEPYREIKTVEDALEYIQTAIGTDVAKVHFFEVTAGQYEMKVFFSHPMTIYITWTGTSVSDVHAYVRIVMMYYSYFYMEAQDVKVAQD